MESKKPPIIGKVKVSGHHNNNGFDVDTINEKPFDHWNYDHWQFHDGYNRILMFAHKDLAMTVDAAAFLARRYVNFNSGVPMIYTGCEAKNAHLIEWSNRFHCDLNTMTREEIHDE